jgi:glutamate/tyrosine decarboxylase-like PLP-dependent enzyme
MIDLSPDDFRQLGYRAIDLLAEHLATSADAPTRRPVPDDLRQQFLTQPLPTEPGDPAALLETVAQDILAYPMGNSSPRFFAWVNSTPAPLGILADLLAAGLGASVAGGDQAATYVEHAVLNWLKTIMRFPASAGGVLASGGSVANLIALGVMRQVKSGGVIRAQGFQGQAAPMVVYTSAQGHSCIQKAVEVLGIGHDYLRKIPVDADYRLDVDKLRAQIAADRAAGLNPVCVAANAGTVNTGAIDPLDALADLCAAENLWLHVDGAYGGVGILAEEVAPLYNGIERADSLAIDPHKWLYMPVECGCTLVKDAQAMRDTFSLIPPYLRDDAALPWFSEFSIQQTRGFKALKLWLVMQQIGVNGYRELISRDIALAKTLQAKIQARPDFELAAAGPLSVTCFRYAPSGVDDLNRLNKMLVAVVQHDGRAFLTSTELNGQTLLRACIVNFRTTEADLDILLDAVAEAGQQVLAAGQ